jgi:hypothetical protein
LIVRDLGIGHPLGSGPVIEHVHVRKLSMKRFVSILVLAAAFAPFALAESGTETTLKGYVVDKHCIAGKSGDLNKKASAMPKTCTLSKACLASGLGLVSEGKWYTFDAKGSAMAAKILEKSKADEGTVFEVTGTVDGDTLTVTSIKEAKEGA